MRIPVENRLGDEGQGFAVAQTRLGGGRVHHAMRSLGACSRAFDMMCERVLSRTTKGGLLAEWRPLRGAAAHLWWSYYRVLKKREGVLADKLTPAAVPGPRARKP